MELAEEIFHMPVRVGAPQYAQGLSDIIRNPIYATAVGLLIFGARDEQADAHFKEGRLSAAGFLDSVKEWFSRHF